MPDRPEGRPAPLWEKPDFAVMSLTDLEELPGFGLEEDAGTVANVDTGGPEGGTVDLRDLDW